MELEKLMKMEHAEIFVNIKGYEGSYMISNLGKVKYVRTGRILKQKISNKGYFIVNLSKNGKLNSFLIHRLVAIAFLPNPDCKPCVDHIDNNPKNNNLLNLRFCSSQENNQNKRLSSNNTSGIKGLYWNKKILKWHARISFNNKRIHIGYFDNIEDAKKARVTKAKQLFGEFINNIEL